MENLRKNLSSSAAGAVGAVSGAIPLAVCSGASCAACLGCVGIGAGVLLDRAGLEDYLIVDAADGPGGSVSLVAADSTDISANVVAAALGVTVSSGGNGGSLAVAGALCNAEGFSL